MLMGNADLSPTCYIVAGPNGAGKTTFAMRYLPAIVNCRKFINADEIAKGLSPLDGNAGLLQASKIFLSALEQHIAQRQNFAFETTLSGRTYLPKIRQWRGNGWRVVLIYLYIPSVDFSTDRIKSRVAQGGHDIPQDAVIRRYPRSLHNLFLYAAECDMTVCFDNTSGMIKPIFEQDISGRVKISDRESYIKIREDGNYD